MSRLLLAFCALIFLDAHALFAAVAPANDGPFSPTYIGGLNPGSTCPFSSVVTPNFLLNQTTIGATAEFPQPALMNCIGTGDMPNPMLDVWYKFTASSAELSLVISGTTNQPLQNPCVGLYLYTGDPLSMQPIQCAKGSNGLLSVNFNPLVPGADYCIQVGGANANETGNFDIFLGNAQNCLSCSQKAVLVADPAPVLGYYPPNQVVNFYYVLDGYRMNNNNALHGVVPIFGPGWDITTLIFNPSVVRTSTTPGFWTPYTYANLPVLGTQPGLFFDDPAGDGPPNNTGDAGSLYDKWVFSWQIKTGPCPTPLRSLNVAVHLFSDGTTGQGAPQPGCLADPAYHFSAVLNCCGNLSSSVANETCPNNCDGNIVAGFQQSTGFLPPYNYFWFDNTGFPVQNTTLQTATSDAYNNACSGFYTFIASSISSPGCFLAQNIPVQSGIQIASVIQGGFPCSNTTPTFATVNVQPPGNYLYTWTPSNQTTMTATGLLPGNTYTVTVSNGNCTISDTITIRDYPQDDPFFMYPSSIIAKCANGIMQIDPLYVATPGGSFSSSQTGFVDPLTGQLDLNAVTPGVYNIVYNTPGPCPAVYTVQVTIVGQDVAYFSYPGNMICSSDINTHFPDSVLAYGGYFYATQIAGPNGVLLVDSASGALSPPYLQGTYVVHYESPNPGPCHASYTDTLTIIPPPAVPTGQTQVFFCPGDNSLTMNVTTTCNGCFPVWTPDPNNGPFYFSYAITINPQTDPLTYYVVAADSATGCVSGALIVNAVQGNTPVPNISSTDTVICPGYTGSLHAGFGSGYSFSWTPSTNLDDPTIPDPTFTATGTMTYTLYVTDLTTSCSGSGVFTVTVDSTMNCNGISFYNGITPNGDGINDSWIIDGITLHPKNHVSIYNRWGQLLWDRADYDNRTVVWTGENNKGRELPSGTYFFVIQASDLEAKKGWVELSR